MKKIIRLTESNLTRLVRRTIMEMESGSELEDLDNWIENNSEYISEYSLMEKLVELFNLNEEVKVYSFFSTLKENSSECKC